MKLNKLWRASFLTLAFTFASHGEAKAQNTAYKRDAYISVDANTGQVLNEKQADKKVYPASTTKIMTAYLTFQALRSGKIKRDQMLHISPNAASIPYGYTKLYLTAYERIKAEDALKGMMVKSANDAAVVLAESISITEDEFVKLMNETAQCLGMFDTHFTNPNGMKDYKQYTTLNDMVILTRALLDDFPEEYATYCGIEKFTYDNVTYLNYNGMLQSYEGVDGLKTGYLDMSGFNIVCSATKGDDRLIVIRFGAAKQSQREKDVTWLLNIGFEKLRVEKPLDIEMIKPVLDTSNSIQSDTLQIKNFPMPKI